MAISNIKITYSEANNTCSNKTNDRASTQAETEEWKKDFEKLKMKLVNLTTITMIQNQCGNGDKMYRTVPFIRIKKSHRNNVMNVKRSTDSMDMSVLSEHTIPRA